MLNILIEDGPEAAFDSFLIQQTLQRRFMTFESLLSLDERYIHDGLRGLAVDLLEERRDQVKTVLAVYRDSKKRGV